MRLQAFAAALTLIVLAGSSRAQTGAVSRRAGPHSIALLGLQSLPIPGLGGLQFPFGTDSGSCAVGGTVFLDSNQNKILDPGEPVFANWKVRIRSVATLEVTHKLTNLSGRYFASGLDAGTYVITAVRPGGYVPDLPSKGKVKVTLIPLTSTIVDVPIQPITWVHDSPYDQPH